jgi:cytochrome c biogenesis protein CcdA
MLNICISLFITGMLMGSGPCMLSCGPILLSYIAGTSRSALSGLYCWFVFSLSKLAAVIFLSFLAGFVGVIFLRRFYWEMPGHIIWLLTGGFVVFLGFMVFFNAHGRFRLCNHSSPCGIRHDTKGLIVLGLLIGALPCVPLLGVLTYISMVSTHYMHGILMGAAFGLGVIVSPLIFGSMIAGAITGFRIFQNTKFVSIFQRICGIILISLGLHIIVNTIMEFTIRK